MHTLAAALALTLLLPGLALLAQNPEAPSDEAAIRHARDLSNRAMAQHDIPAFGASLAPDYVAVFGDGAFIKSRAACIHAFQLVTQAPAEHLITYQRIPDKIELRTNHHQAAEHGHWIGRRPDGTEAWNGTYLAMWRKDPAGWKIRSELFITLHGPTS